MNCRRDRGDDLGRKIREHVGKRDKEEKEKKAKGGKPDDKGKGDDKGNKGGGKKDQ